MATQRGKILLEGKKIYVLTRRMRVLRKQKEISCHDMDKLEKVAKMASWYIKGVEEFASSRGQYQECFPALAKGISRTFHATDGEMAICFGVSYETFREWIRTYPKLRAAISVGKGVFTRVGDHHAYYRRLLYPGMAERICSEFNADDETLARCFGVDLETFEQWLQGDPKFLNSVIHGRQVDQGERKRIANEVWGGLQDPKDDDRIRLRHLDLLQDMVDPEKKTLSEETICDFARRVSRLVDLLHSKEDTSILSWLNQYVEKEARADLLRSVEKDYQEAFKRYEVSVYRPDAAQGRFFDGMQYVYCYLKGLPVGENTRADAVKWFLPGRTEHNLGRVLVAYAIGFLIEAMLEE
jgi:hypothetical protein